MLTAGIAILAGVLLACLSPQPVDRWWITWLPVCLYIAYINPTRWRLVMLGGAAFLWASLFIHWQLDHRWPGTWNNKRLVVVGEVLNIPQNSDYATRFELLVQAFEPAVDSRPRKIRLSWRDPPDQFAAGQRWQLKVKLRQPHGMQNPGGFDYERWLFVRGIHATGYVLDSADNRLLGSNPWALAAIRESIDRWLKQICPDCRNRGLISALAIGYRGHIETAHSDLLQRTGTAHLIAISGLHIGIIASVFYALSSLLWKWRLHRWFANRRQFAMTLAWVGGLGYSLLSGFELPAQRAMLMLTVLLIGIQLRQPFNLLHSIMLAMILVLLLNPLVVLSASFWLTFSALLIIALGIFLLPRQTSRWRQLLTIQLLFSLLFVPLSIYLFGQVHSASLLANLVAVPLVSFIIVPLNFLLLGFSWLPESWLQTLYQLLDGLLGGLIVYLRWLQQIGLQAWHPGHIAGWKLLVLALCLLLLLLPTTLLLPRRWLLPVVLLLMLPQRQIGRGELEMTVLDVGMGTSIVVQTRDHSLVYDFGPGNDRGYSLGEWVVLPFLAHQGLDDPDRIVISHADQDHAGGFYKLASRYNAITVYTGTAAKVREKFPGLTQVRDCHQIPPWHWDGVRFEFLGGLPLATESDNNRSCVLKISAGQASILVAGDIEKRQEWKLLATANSALAADVLVAPHHGSMTSSSPLFVNAVNAQQVIFTTGFQNRWHFPRPTVVARYARTGAAIHQTDRDGAISIFCNQQGCQLESFRERHPRLWY